MEGAGERLEALGKKLERTEQIDSCLQGQRWKKNSLRKTILSITTEGGCVRERRLKDQQRKKTGGLLHGCLPLEKEKILQKSFVFSKKRARETSETELNSLCRRKTLLDVQLGQKNKTIQKQITPPRSNSITMALMEKEEVI